MSLDNTTGEKSVSMNTTVNGSSSSQELIQSDKSRSRKNWTNSCNLILAVSLIGNFLIVYYLFTKHQNLRPVSNVALLPR